MDNIVADAIRVLRTLASAKSDPAVVHFDLRRREPQPIPARSRSFTEDNEGNEERQDGMAFGPSDFSANGAPPFQPGPSTQVSKQKRPKG